MKDERKKRLRRRNRVDVLEEVLRHLEKSWLLLATTRGVEGLEERVDALHDVVSRRLAEEGAEEPRGRLVEEIEGVGSK